MRRVFLDTSHLIAIFNDDDEWHERAVAAAARLGDEGPIGFVTTLLVAEEFLTNLAKRDPAMRERAATFVDRILSDPLVEVVGISLRVFASGLDLTVSVSTSRTAWSTVSL